LFSNRRNLWAFFSCSTLSICERWFTGSCPYDLYITCEQIFAYTSPLLFAIRSLLPTPLLGYLRFPNRTESTETYPDAPQTPTKNLLLCYSIKVSSVLFVFIIRLGSKCVCVVCANLTMQLFFISYLFTPWSRVLLEKLTVNSAASQEIPHIYGTRKFLTLPTRALHLSLSNFTAA
jgi:hypothetical protein